MSASWRAKPRKRLSSGTVRGACADDEAAACNCVDGAGERGKRSRGEEWQSDGSLTAVRRSPSPGVVDLTADADDSIVSDGTLVRAALAAEEAEKKRPKLTDLPPELLQRIFERLPVTDLLLNLRPLCRAFHAAISSDKFVPWKKLYYQYRYFQRTKQGSAVVNKLLVEGDMQTRESNLLNVLLFVHRNLKKSPPPGRLRVAFGRLRSLAEFAAADKWLETRARPALAQKPSIWVYVSVLCLLAPDALFIRHLMRSLTAEPGGLVPVDLTECLYMLATLLLGAHRQLHVSNRAHYNVFSALYFFENAGGKSYSDLAVARTMRGGVRQASMHQFVRSTGANLTFEQFRIVNYALKPDDCVRIIAFAGTGKTTTLLECAKARPGQRFLVLLYNKDVAVDTANHFPHNAKCVTTHSLAYNYEHAFDDGRPPVAIGQRYRGKLWSNLGVSAVVKVIDGKAQAKTKGGRKAKGDNEKGMNLYLRARLAVQTLQSFLASADETISGEHAPSMAYDEKKQSQSMISSTKKAQLVEDATLLWRRMRDPADRDVGMLHDGYLKLFQLARPQLSDATNGRPWDAILVDEAQDMNPATLDAILRQRAVSPLIFVGDPNQQIYAFRGAVDALDLVAERATRTFYLTQSFRFGPEIAFLANSWLETLRDEKQKMLIGTEKAARLDVEQPPSPLCIIARNNATIFDECVRISRIAPTPRLTILGGFDKFGFSDLMDLHVLMMPVEKRGTAVIKNKLIAKFKHVQELLEYAKRTMDIDLERSIAIALKYNEQIPAHLERIKAAHTTRMDATDFILTTAHKAKGMEFESVQLAADFKPVDELEASARRGGGERDQLANELNLIYVAMTRAKRSLIINESLYDMLRQRCAEWFERPAPFGCVKAQLADARCFGCKKPCDSLADDDIVLFRRPVTVAGLPPSRLATIESGVAHSACVVDRVPPVGYRNVDTAERFTGKSGQIQVRITVGEEVCFEMVTASNFPRGGLLAHSWLQPLITSFESSTD